MDTTQAYWQAGEATVARRDAVQREQFAFLASVLDFLGAYPSPELLPSPAGETVAQAGSEGTTSTGEFASLDVAALLGISRPAASSLVHEASDSKMAMPTRRSVRASLQSLDGHQSRPAQIPATHSAQSAACSSWHSSPSTWGTGLLMWGNAMKPWGMPK